MDGVLLDSEAAGTRAQELARLAAPRRAAGHDGDELDRVVASMHETIGLPESPDEINAEVVRRMSVRYRERLPLVPGAVAAVERLAPTGLSASRARRTAR